MVVLWIGDSSESHKKSGATTKKNCPLEQGFYDVSRRITKVCFKL